MTGGRADLSVADKLAGLAPACMHGRPVGAGRLLQYPSCTPACMHGRPVGAGRLLQYPSDSVRQRQVPLRAFAAPTKAPVRCSPVWLSCRPTAAVRPPSDLRETALPPSERFWRAVRMQWTPQLETWRPRVNGVQLKVRSARRRGGGGGDTACVHGHASSQHHACTCRRQQSRAPACWAAPTTHHPPPCLPPPTPPPSPPPLRPHHRCWPVPACRRATRSGLRCARRWWACASTCAQTPRPTACTASCASLWPWWCPGGRTGRRLRAT